MGINDSLIDIHTHKIPAAPGISIVNIILKDKSYGENITPLETINKFNEPDIYFSVGVHPWFLSAWENQIELLEEIANLPKVIAIGECGLDKTKGITLDKQAEIFNIHIRLSEKLEKPLIIHCVKAYNELIRTRSEMQPKQPWIIHGFSSSPQIANQCIESGMCISLGKVLFNNSLTIRSLLQAIPLSRLFLETDENDYTIDDVYQKYATLMEITVDQLKFEMVKNFDNYFKF
jgi:TatD DNase family protein